MITTIIILSVALTVSIFVNINKLRNLFYFRQKHQEWAVWSISIGITIDHKISAGVS